MPRIKNGFKGERTIVLPAFLIEKLKQDPLGQELYITDIGYYPHANFHYCERTAEEVNEFVLIYCVEAVSYTHLDVYKRQTKFRPRILFRVPAALCVYETQIDQFLCPITCFRISVSS